MIEREFAKNFMAFITEATGAEAEYLWDDTPDCAVFRHSTNRKWFAIVMSVKRRSLGMDGEGTVDVINFKLEPTIVQLLVDGKGFRTAYHMNKTHWITVLLDGSVPQEEIAPLLMQSYELTADRRTVRKK